MWTGSDDIFKTPGGRALVIWGGEAIEAMACWTCVPPGPGLQAAIDSLGTGGGNLMLQPGTYTGDITISNSNISLYGSGRDKTILSGSVTIAAGNITLHDLWAYGNGKAYGIKMYAVTGGTPRNHLNRVRIGGNSDSGGRAPSGDGPQVGLWLDSAIVTVCDHCLFAFCNTGSGLYVNSTSGTWSTNCNSFRDCTFNGNAGYGIEIIVGVDGVASMLLHNFVGGNMEDNASGEVKVDSAIGIRLQDIDFETTKTIGATLDITASNVIIENCHGVVAGGGAVTRFFLIAAGRSVVRHCRISGNYTSEDVGVFTDTGNRVFAYDNQWETPIGTAGNVTVTPRWINNRASEQGYS